MNIENIQTILISRTDSIGDVVLTLPMAIALKQEHPEIQIGFLGKKYTEAVINTCTHIDEFIEMEDFLSKEITIKGKKIDCIIHVLPNKAIAQRAKKLRIPWRIGTRNRLFHWWTCNKLIALSRKNSALHEAQLNLLLLKAFLSKVNYSLEELNRLQTMDNVQSLPQNFADYLSEDKTNLILHPKSQGNGQEWPLEYFIELIQLLDPKKFRIFISGTAPDKEKMKCLFEEVGNKVVDITGEMQLSEFIAFIQEADVLVASGTGPLHIAAAVGTYAIGIFPPIRPIHPGRWRPIGLNTRVVCSDIAHDKEVQNSNYYIQQIKPLGLLKVIESCSIKKELTN